MNRIADLRRQLLDLSRLRQAGVIDEAAHDKDRLLLERALIDLVLTGEDAAPSRSHWPWLAAGMAALVVLTAAFWWQGRPGSGQAVQAMTEGVNVEAQSSDPTSTDSNQQLAEMTQRLAERMAGRPDDAQGWAMLARSRALLAQPDLAAQAYEKALALEPRNATWLAEQAQVQVLRRGGHFGSEEEAMVRKVLTLEPGNLKGLWLAGTLAFERHDYGAAVKLWERMLQIGPIEALDVSRLQSGIAEARKRLELGVLAVAGRASGP